MERNLKRINKDLAGYIILCVMAEADQNFEPREAEVIKEYILEHFPLGGNFDDAIELLGNTSQEDYPLLLQKCAEDFFVESVEKERYDFLQFAMSLIKADDKIDENENWMFNKLYQYWDIDTSRD